MVPESVRAHDAGRGNPIYPHFAKPILASLSAPSGAVPNGQAKPSVRLDREGGAQRRAMFPLGHRDVLQGIVHLRLEQAG